MKLSSFAVFPSHSETVSVRMASHLLLLSSLLLLKSVQGRGVLETYVLASFEQPESERTSLNHFVFDNRTGSTYVAADKYLYHLSSDFEVSASTGTTEQSCADDVFCQDFTKILAIVGSDDINSVITCRSSDGLCAMRNLSDISQELNPDSVGQVVVPGESSDLTSVGVVAPGPASSTMLYVANTLSSKVPSIIYPIKRWDLENSELSYSSGNVDHLDLELDSNFKIYYEGAFTYNGYVYFLMNEKVEEQFVSKLGRVCFGADDDLSSYTEITLHCQSRGSPATVYNLIQGAHLGSAGDGLREALNGSGSVLFAAFTSGSPLADPASSDAAVCMFSMEAVERAFLQAVKDCISGVALPLSYLQTSSCISLQLDDDALVEQILCQTGSHPPVYRYANGYQDLVSSAALEFSGTPSAILSSTERQHTLLFIGTAEGTLHKVHLENQTGRIYETLTLGTNPVLPDMHQAQNTSILVATQQQLYRLAVAECGQYSSCDECVGARGADDGDPYCGWCTLESRCSRHGECADPDVADRWLAYDTPQCISIQAITPPSLPRLDSQLQRNIRFTVPHLPILQDGSAYSCRFDNISSEATESVGNSVTCLSPPANQLPAIRPGSDRIAVSLTLHVGQSARPIVSTDYYFYACSLITSCSSCVASEFGCHWCVHGNTCSHNQSLCHADDTVITGISDTVESALKGPEWCPQVLPLIPPIDIPVGLPRGFQLQAANLPMEEDGSYECVVHVEGGEQPTPAKVLNQSTVMCQNRQYSYHSGSLRLTVPVSLRWKGMHRIDTIGDLNVTLYDCSFERDSCSRCVSPMVTPAGLACGWCTDRCDVQGSQACQASWIPQSSNQSCPGPVILGITPTSGPIEGNTLVDITGRDLGFTFTDIAGIHIGSTPCLHAGLQDRYRIGSRVSCVTSASGAGEQDGVVSVSVLDSRNTVQQSEGAVTFSYKDPAISGFSPDVGLAYGGTVVTITGVSLNTGSNITAHVGGTECEIEAVMGQRVQCRTGPGDENSTGPVVMRFDGTPRQTDGAFSYRPNPRVMALSQHRTIRSGGVNMTITGEGFSIIQRPVLIAALRADPNATSSVPCNVSEDTAIVCPSPSEPVRSPSLGQERRRRRRGGRGSRRDWRRRREVQEATLTLSLDGFQVEISDSFEFYPDPVYKLFDETDRIKDVTGNSTLRISGSNLDVAVTKADVRVMVGQGFCEVLSISAEVLLCHLPPSQPAVSASPSSYRDGGSVSVQPPHPSVIVLHGMTLRFPLGYVRYADSSHFSTLLAVIIATLIGVAIVFILIVVSFYGRRVHQNKLRTAEHALTTLENQLKDKATEAFHDLQRDMSDLREQLKGLGMPFVSGADYIRNMLFWGLKVQPLTHDPELPQESVRSAMMEFSKRLSSKQFLTDYIRELDEARTLQQKDRVNIASLLAIILTTEGRFHYLTDVMLTLMEEKIAEADEAKLNLLFRRTESILEKLISNWIALCMYRHLQRQVAYPLYMLYQAIKCQCEKGPVDAVTGQSHFSLNFDYLLDEDIKFEEVTLQVVDSEFKVTEQVKVLDVDTITQAKQKILDAKYCKRQITQNLRSNEVDLVLLNGHSGQLVLRDRDELSEVNGVWVKANTIKTYKISNGSSVAIVKKQTESDTSYLSPLALDKQDLTFSSINHVPAANDLRTSWEYTQIDVEPEEGKQMWHLVRDESAVKSPHKSKGSHVELKPKLIKEVYSARLLVTKNAVQYFLDEYLNASFSIPDGQASLPVHIKHLFDFFDQQADKLGRSKVNTAERWKNNSLPRRFWVTTISHPSFIFNMQQSQTADYCMNVLTNMLDNACKKDVPKYNPHASLNRLLYRPELERYIEIISGYYDSIAAMPPVSEAQLEEASQQISKEFCSHFSLLGMLHQLYEFTREHTDMLDEISAIIKERDD